MRVLQPSCLLGIAQGSVLSTNPCCANPHLPSKCHDVTLSVHSDGIRTWRCLPRNTRYFKILYEVFDNKSTDFPKNALEAVVKPYQRLAEGLAKQCSW